MASADAECPEKMPTRASATKMRDRRPRRRATWCRCDVPTKPSSAGSSVIAAIIMTSTPGRAGDGQAADELEAHDEQAEQRDHDGDAGEQHGAAGRVDRLDGGVLGFHAARAGSRDTG